MWALVIVLYPILSVYPQELIFRAFLFHRYAPLFGNGVGLVAASAAAFGSSTSHSGTGSLSPCHWSAAPSSQLGSNGPDHC